MEDTTFSARLELSASVDEACRQILGQRVPGGTIRLGTVAEDKKGADYIVTTPKGLDIHVDFKIRTEDHGDDVCLEYVSSIEDMRVGWTVDEGKTTNYVVWYWTDTNRWLAYDFKQLRTVAKACAFTWLNGPKSSGFQQIENHTHLSTRPDYHSRAVCVPTKFIEAILESRFDKLLKWSGVIVESPKENSVALTGK